MKKMFSILSVVCVVFLIVGFIFSDAFVAPVCRAVGAVFFILAFICKIAQCVESESEA